MTQDQDQDQDIESGVRIDEEVIHEWRAQRLTELGLTNIIAHAFADLVDWHDLAGLIERGCSPELALEIVR